MSDLNGGVAKHKAFVLDEATAKKEVNNWFEYIDFDGFQDEEDAFDSDENDDPEESELKLSEEELEEIESKRPFYHQLINWARKGVLIFHEDGKIEHKLLRSIKKENGEIYLDTLIYDCDIPYGKFQTQMKGKDSSNGDIRLSALVAAITGKPSSVLYKLRPKDTKISQAIAVFTA